MSRKGYIAIVLLLTLCTAGAAPALPFGPETADNAGERGVFSELWERFVEWIDQATGRAGDGLSLWVTDGCHLDPNGSPCGSGT